MLVGWLMRPTLGAAYIFDPPLCALPARICHLTPAMLAHSVVDRLSSPQADRATVLSQGRFYSALESTIAPRLPSITSMLANCDLTDATAPCVDIINTRCLTGASGNSLRPNATATTACKPLAKETPSYDAGRIETMIDQGDLPLSIVYMGVGGTERLIRSTDETVLFYWWGVLQCQSAIASQPHL